jgi:hypothetical protein
MTVMQKFDDVASTFNVDNSRKVMLTTATVIIITVTFVTVENLTEFNYMTCVHECSILDYCTPFLLLDYKCTLFE